MYSTLTWHAIILPLIKQDVKRTLIFNENNDQISISDHYGYIVSHYLVGKIRDFSQKTELIVNPIVQSIPIPISPVDFVDGSTIRKGGLHGRDLHLIINSPCISAQRVKLSTISTLLKKLSSTLKVLSDSLCSKAVSRYCHYNNQD